MLVSKLEELMPGAKFIMAPIDGAWDRSLTRSQPERVDVYMKLMITARTDEANIVNVATGCRSLKQTDLKVIMLNI